MTKRNSKQSVDKSRCFSLQTSEAISETAYQKGDIFKLLAVHSSSPQTSAVPTAVSALFVSQPEKNVASVNACKKAAVIPSTTPKVVGLPSSEKNMQARLTIGLQRARLVEKERIKKEKSITPRGDFFQCDPASTTTALETPEAKDEPILLETTAFLEQENENEEERSSAALDFGDDARRKEITRRTLFVGNVPLNVTASMLRTALTLKKAQIDSIRFRSVPVDPKLSAQRAWAASKEKYANTCDVKNAYVVFTNELDVQAVLKKTAATPITLEGKRLRFSSVSLQRRVFSAFPRRATVFVGNLCVKTTEDALRQAFEQHVGPVANVRIVRDSKLYISKGFGFVQLTDRVHIPKAIREMHGFILDKRPLNVTKAVTEEVARRDDKNRQALIARKIERKRRLKVKAQVDHRRAKKAKKRSKPLLPKQVDM